jgi:hypothetical protein
MELLVISLSKESSLFRHAFHGSPFYYRIFKKIILFSDFTSLYKKKIRETRKLEHFVERTNEGRKPDRNSNLSRLEFMPRNLTPD